MRIPTAFLLTIFVTGSLCAQNQPGIRWTNGSNPASGGANAFPWGSCGLRYQQIVDGSMFKARTCLIQDIFVTGDANRPDRLIEHLDIQISMGRTAVTNAKTTANWNTNLPPKNKTVVYRGPLEIFHAWSQWRGIGLPVPYRFARTVSEPNLCIEIITWKIKGYAAPSNFYFPRKADTGLGGGVRRAYRYNWINNQTLGPLTGIDASRIGLLCNDGNFVITGRACGNLAMAGSLPAWPQGGKPYAVYLSGAAINSPALLLLGMRLAPPIDLTPIGMRSCTWYANPIVVLVTQANGVGIAALKLPLPNMLGARGYVQWLNRDPSANALGWTSSELGTIIIGT